MTKTPSTQRLALGTEAPDFSLPSVNGFSRIKLSDYSGKKGYLIAFICNHCPYVKHISSRFAQIANDYQKRGIAAFAINSNDVSTYPDDSPEKMSIEAKQKKYEFPYLFDEDQSVAKSYFAACTPDFFLFDQDKKLFYRGQCDNSRPSNDIPVTCGDLISAMDCLLQNGAPPEEQKPSLGCNIKWKKDNSPDYF